MSTKQPSALTYRVEDWFGCVDKSHDGDDDLNGDGEEEEQRLEDWR